MHTKYCGNDFLLTTLVEIRGNVISLFSEELSICLERPTMNTSTNLELFANYIDIFSNTNIDNWQLLISLSLIDFGNVLQISNTALTNYLPLFAKGLFVALRTSLGFSANVRTWQGLDRKKEYIRMNREKSQRKKPTFERCSC